jgi:predicted membrane protein
MNLIEAIWNYFLLNLKIMAGITLALMILLFVAAPKTFKLSDIRMFVEVGVTVAVGGTIVGAFIAAVFLSIGKLSGQ